MNRAVLLATRNLGKLRELRPLFARAGIGVRDLMDAGLPESSDEDALESYSTFEENAIAKARYFFHLSGIEAVADDSGLEVAALRGEPGVRSKRWSGRADLSGMALDHANNAKLLAQLSFSDDRRARFVCAAAWVDGSGERVARGETHGRILTQPRGTLGFGYDPLFESDDLGMTFGEADGPAKEVVSHRGRAFRALLAGSPLPESGNG
ncbi:MAG: non-canonical purine NTP pyrophosphatase [Gemmatimonadaceae bacterium]|nr:non-canonical purine NTP pyrophosphatase [Gemmatimonadaceae bacterium]MDQ3520081.1 non-canonical purine NTP pyrophosphatase [Gemmatimonadota bacterium]